MTLILDRRAELDGKPGIHAFIAGVSFYRHLPGGDPDAKKALKTFGLKQLTSTAKTGWLFYQWLLKADEKQRLPLPLATIHLLLSPSPAEIAADAALANLVSRATYDNFLEELTEWRDFASDPEGMTIFYFAGHGVQRQLNDSVLLFEDFGKPPGGSLKYAADVAQIVNGMAPPKDLAKKIANRQIYFIDACRMPDKEFKLNEWMDVPPLWDINPGVDNRTRPVFYAAVPGTSAYAVPGGQTLFSAALTSCLDHVAAKRPGDEENDDDPRWRVTTASLFASIQSAIDAVNEQHNGKQECLPDPVGKNIVLTYLDEIPTVDCVVDVDPAEAGAVCEFRLTTADDAPVYETVKVQPNPHAFKVKGGLYTYVVKPADAQYKAKKDYADLKPRLPNFKLKVKVKA